MLGPMHPDSVVDSQKQQIPQEVFDIINELIAQNWDGHSSIITQEDILTEMNQSSITLAKKYLNIEEAYRSVGWKVLYDKPGYSESYPATFTFTKE